ncbi:hypothetical protein NM208_g11561 [Fusarium decemcellulare]|uniref:Uncharacterized protein n=1 Tax=Fusarium decemcellulare TaxID=57161 RepID=A0ACC1RU87_9HYPO|nr:hypothetical protein NM208_g11561 [Fusarium decemcellulare]
MRQEALDIKRIGLGGGATGLERLFLALCRFQGTAFEAQTPDCQDAMSMGVLWSTGRPLGFLGGQGPASGRPLITMDGDASPLRECPQPSQPQGFPGTLRDITAAQPGVDAMTGAWASATATGTSARARTLLLSRGGLGVVRPCYSIALVAPELGLVVVDFRWMLEDEGASENHQPLEKDEVQMSLGSQGFLPGCETGGLGLLSQAWGKPNDERQGLCTLQFERAASEKRLGGDPGIGRLAAAGWWKMEMICGQGLLRGQHSS